MRSRAGPGVEDGSGDEKPQARAQQDRVERLTGAVQFAARAAPEPGKDSLDQFGGRPGEARLGPWPVIDASERV